MLSVLVSGPAGDKPGVPVAAGSGWESMTCAMAAQVEAIAKVRLSAVVLEVSLVSTGV